MTRALEKQRIEFQEQYQNLSDQYELKCIEYKKLVDELNRKDKNFRESSVDHNTYDYDIMNLKDENSRLFREISIIRDEAQKYKLRLNQSYKEIDSYKASLFSFEKQ